MKRGMKLFVAVLVLIVASYIICMDAVNTNSHAVSLDGNSQYLSAADSASLSPTGNITIEGWVKVNRPAVGNEELGFVSKFNTEASDGRAYGSWFTASGPDWKLQFRYGNTSGETSRMTGSPILTKDDLNKWVHVAITADVSRQIIAMYKNGVPVVVESYDNHATSIRDNNQELRIGIRNELVPANNTHYFPGFIDDVRIWSVTRTSEEILKNKSVELAGKERNLLAYWKLNNAFEDSTENGNMLTSHNAATFDTRTPFPFQYVKSFLWQLRSRFN